MQNARETGSVRLLFRFVVGGSALAVEWLGAALREIDRQATPVETSDLVRVSAGSVVVGALSSALRWRPVTASPVSRGTALATRRGLRLLARVPGSGLVRRRYDRARASAGAQARRWAEEGAREVLAGRRLARLATPALVELVIARVAESPELRTVIEEQSEGLAAHSVAELRERSHEADRTVERTVQRFVSRVLRRDGGA